MESSHIKNQKLVFSDPASKIIEHIEHGIIILNSENLIIYTNSIFLEIIGEIDIVGRNLFDFAPLENQKKLIQELFQENRLREKNTQSSNIIRINNKHYCIKTSSFKEDEKLISFTDISEIINQEKALEESNLELEFKVEERTRKLSDVINALKEEIEERKKIETALRESENRYALAVKGANEVLWEINLENKNIYLSPRWKKLLGLENIREIGTFPSWLRRIHPEDRSKLIKEFKDHISGKNHKIKVEHRMKHNDGEYRWLLTRGLAAKNEKGDVIRVAGSISDINKSKEAENKMLFNAYHDKLTGLGNRVLFLDRLHIALSKAKRSNKAEFAVMFMDMDRFKSINDSLGHLVGDLVLKETASRLKECLREIDTVSRFGGDEFVALIENITSIREVTIIAERIIKKMQREMNIESQEILTSISIGIAVYNNSHNNSEDILRNADIALYRAKEQGKNRYSLFRGSRHNKEICLLKTENELKKAIDKKEFVLFYQPIISLKDNKTIGFEALIRWKHPKKGLVFPDEFISLAENTDLIKPIGQWVLKKACSDMAKWNKNLGNDEYYISVNISKKQLTDHDILSQLKKTISESGINPKNLVLEITESSIIKDFEIAKKTLLNLKKMGLRIHMDDFGAGYSSLSLLTKLPIDSMKIDKSFIMNMQKDKSHINTVKTIINLGHNLNKTIIAEGIENVEIANKLKGFSCEFGQGYYFAKPMKNSSALKFIKN